MFEQEILNLQKKQNYINAKVVDFDKNVNIYKGKVEEIERQTEQEVKNRQEEQDKQVLYQKTAIFCSKLLEKMQEVLEEIFGNMGTAALSKIFGEDKKLKFTFDKNKQKNPSVDIVVSQPWDENEDLETSIANAEGGAMKDIVALGLRLAMMKMITPEPEGPIFLDEICRYIAANEGVKAAGEFIREFANKLDKQMIIITHKPELLDYADKVFTVEIAPKKTVRIKERVNTENE